MHKSIKILGAVAVAGIVAASGSAFTAGNSVEVSDAGSGFTAIEGFVTSDVQYDANNTDPQNLDAVTFTLDKAARYVAIRTHNEAVSTDDEWFTSDDLRLNTGADNSCTTSNQTTWTCDVTGAGETVVGADNLTVVATS